jgi:DNA-binding HxlR family transcriptional regulator
MPAEWRPVGDFLALIGDKWTVMIIGALGDGKKLGHQLLQPLAGLAEFALMNQFQVEHSRRRFDELIDHGSVAVTVVTTDADRSTH